MKILHHKELMRQKLIFYNKTFDLGTSMHEASYKSVSVDEKSALLKRYYIELDSKYYGGKKETDNFFSLLSEDVYFWVAILQLAWRSLVVNINLCFWF